MTAHPQTPDTARALQLARDILENFRCNCNEEESPSLCDCGGDGAGELRDPSEGCWACQAYTALHGYGTPREPEDDPRDEADPNACPGCGGSCARACR